MSKFYLFTETDPIELDINNQVCISFPGKKAYINTPELKRQLENLLKFLDNLEKWRENGRK
jgi:hypothetical protein